MENFSNSVIIPENLPEIKKETFTKLDKRYLKIVLIRLIIFALFLVGSFIAFLMLSEINLSPVIIIFISVVLFIILAFSSIISILGFYKKGYLLRENDISYQKGLLIYKLTTVPFNRIQHVEVNQGILAKIFHLSSVKIYTAGGSSSDLSIPGLPVNDAQKLKAFLSEKISAHE